MELFWLQKLDLKGQAVKIHYDNGLLTLDFRQPKVKEGLEFTDMFLLTTLSPTLNSHMVVIQ